MTQPRDHNNARRSPLTPALHYALRIGGLPTSADLPDAELLRRFAGGDAAACEHLVRRHSPMVLGVCRRVLRDSHAADDAFQATFLLLVRKARSLRHPDRLGPWLHGVAYRTALQARTRSLRRREEAMGDVPAPETTPVDDLRTELDTAIDRLPAHERRAVVLCYLEGVTYADAARRLACPLGTLAARLSRARERMRVWLTRQGLAPAAGLLTAGLAAEAPAAPPALVAITVRSAVGVALGATAEVVPETVWSLMQGVRRMMLWHTAKVVLAAGLALGVAGAGVGVVAYRSQAGQAHVIAEPPAVPVAQAKPDENAAKPQPEDRPIPLTLLRQEQPKEYVLGPGDLLAIYVEGLIGERTVVPPVVQVQQTPGGKVIPPMIGYPIPVQESGLLFVPLIEPIDAAGKTIGQVQREITTRYIDRRLVPEGQAPRTFVSLVKARTYRITVVRNDAGGSLVDPAGNVNVPRPGTRAVSLDLEAYDNDILGALTRAGGLPGLDSTNTIVIQRRRAAVPGGFEEARIPLRMRPDQALAFNPNDVILRDGDIILIESRDTVPPATAAPAAANLPAGTPPVTSLAVAVPDGRILLQVPTSGDRPGAAVTWPWQMFPASQLTASETDGRPIDGKALADRLQKMTAVVVALDGRRPDPLYLQVVKPGTPVLVLAPAARR
jgi:RNA polymerase sigma factor (sigma-70 family)